MIMTTEPLHTTSKDVHVTVHVIIVCFIWFHKNKVPKEKQKQYRKGGGHCALFLAMLCLLHSVTNDEPCEKHHCYQSSHLKNTGDKHKS